MSKKTKEKFVVTINNETLPISQTRKYESGFYKIGDTNVVDSGDCYLLSDGKYYRGELDQVVYDYFNKRYVLKNSSLSFGYICSDFKEGYFSKNKDNIVMVDENLNYRTGINPSIIKNYLYRERLWDGYYYHIRSLNASEFNMKYIPDSDYKNQLSYDSKNVMYQYVNNYNTNYIPSQPLDNKDDILSIIGNLSFGLEFETTKGILPDRILNNLGLIPLRDGSISGIEYVTVPLSGEKGVMNLFDSVDELNKRTDFNDKCALHLHLGNVPRTKSFILAFFKLSLGIQDELFSLFNLYKKYNFGYKNKNYSAPYNIFLFMNNIDNVINDSNLDSNFDVLFKHLSEGSSIYNYHSSGDLKNVLYHERDPNGNQKWNIRERYHFHNFIPLIFGNKTTIEFRIHTPTYDKDKILWFLLFNSILVNYVNNNQKSILNNTHGNFNIANIICNHCKTLNLKSNISYHMVDYLNSRKSSVEKFNYDSNIHFDESKIKSKFDYSSSSFYKEGVTYKGFNPSINMAKLALEQFKRINVDYRINHSIKHEIKSELSSLEPINYEYGSDDFSI